MSENKDFNETISNSKEESIRKAILMLEQEDSENKKIKRPNINSKKIILKIVLILFIEICIIILTIFLYNKLDKFIIILLGIIILITFISVTIKETVINLILLYQKFASEKLRSSCLFEPSCSEYMILAIEKYGFIKGFIKGIKRIFRCHYPNGGIDYP